MLFIIVLNRNCLDFKTTLSESLFKEHSNLKFILVISKRTSCNLTIASEEPKLRFIFSMKFPILHPLLEFLPILDYEFALT
jgi:hypothetical protein